MLIDKTEFTFTQKSSCSVYFTSLIKDLLLDSIKETLDSKRKIALILDAEVYYWHDAFIKMTFDHFPKLVLPNGEKTKSTYYLEKIYAFLEEHNIDRQSKLYIMSGGVISDIASFAASTFLRGIEYSIIPTTLLSMVDSGIGGKTGINFLNNKNRIGTFSTPKEIFIDTYFLRTLPEREFNAGLAEVIKYGLLDKSNQIWNQLNKLNSLTYLNSALQDIIEASYKTKIKIVKKDPFETIPDTGRLFLNLGHTFGHAIESADDIGNYLHGEAVAIGMAMAANLSCELGHLNNATCQEILELIKKYHLPTHLVDPLKANQLIDLMRKDKKNTNNSIKLILLKGIGKPFITSDVPLESIEKLWHKHNAI